MFIIDNNIVNILEPEEPKVTEAQFVEAQKWQERNKNWSEFTDAADTIKRYRKQNDEARQNHTIQCEKIKEIAAASVKRINHIAQDSEKIAVENATDKSNEETA